MGRRSPPYRQKTVTHAYFWAVCERGCLATPHPPYRHERPPYTAPSACGPVPSGSPPRAVPPRQPTC